MKTVMRNTAMWLIIAFSFFSAACSNIFEEPADISRSPQGAGRVQVILPGASSPENQERTILPDFSGITYKLVFNSEEHGERTEEISSEGSGEFDLGAGAWSLAVEAFAGSSLIARGTVSSFFVLPGKTASVSVTLSPVSMEDGEGSLDYTVDFPGGTSPATLELFHFTSGSLAIPAIDLTAQSSDRLENIPAGYYRLVVKLARESGNKIAGKSDIVHIYKGRTSEFAWKFAAADFADKRTYFTSVEELSAYLAAQPQNTRANPYPVTLRVNMADLPAVALNGGTYKDPLGKLYAALNGRYVSLDMSDSVGDIPDGSLIQSSTIGEQRLNADKIVTLKLPSSLKRIGSWAFYQTNIDVIFPESLEVLGASCFWESPLTSFDFSGTPNLRLIGDRAFLYTQASSFDFSHTRLTEIVSYAFASTSITQLILPQTIRKISLTGFPAGITSWEVAGTGPVSTGADGKLLLLTEGGEKTVLSCIPGTTGTVSVPEGVTKIGDYAFDNAKCHVTLPNTVKSIGDYAFQSTALTSFDFPSALESIGAYAFYRGVTSSAFAALGAFPASLKRIGPYAFAASSTSNAPAYTTVDMSAAVQITSIPERAFSNSVNITEVTLPPAVKSIGDYAFNACNSLKTIGETDGSIILPASLENLGSNAFIATSGAPNAYAANRTAIDLSSTKLTVLNNSAFSENRYIATVEFPACLKIIGPSSFSSTIRLVNIVFPEGSQLETIDSSAFYTDPYLSGANTACTNLTLPDSVKVIGSSAFRNFTGLVTVSLPASIQYLNGQAFYNASALTAFTLRGSGTLSAIDGGAALKMGSTVVAVAGGYTGTITVPEGVTEIAPYALSYAKFNDLDLPSTLKTIGTYAFYRSNTSFTVTIAAEDPPVLGSSAFNNNYLTSITVPTDTSTAYKAAANWSSYAVKIAE